MLQKEWEGIHTSVIPPGEAETEGSNERELQDRISPVAIDSVLQKLEGQEVK